MNDVLQRAMQVAPEGRATFLDGACATDDSLRHEVESLLAADDEASSGFLRSPLAGLATRSRLGDYEIQCLLGAGGMGEVYRARDLRLRREVAIKVLPALFSSDPDRLRRFEQEAIAAAALNHPNILAVFQMSAHEGAPYLVSELLEGETLREHIKAGRIAMRKALDYAVHTAHGLAAAHEKGIVHRDLKPENLFVTKDGRIKILDFGLAKLTQLQPDSSVLTADGEIRTGVVMGTIGYMSPEQVRGQTADHRADIFAFGAIIYEMLTGQRAFQKPTAAETMTAILNEEPSPVSQSAPHISLALQQVVHRCLEKNREQRFQSASDLAFALEALSDPHVATSGAGWEWSRRVWRSKYRTLLLLLGAAIVAALLLALITSIMYWRSGENSTRDPVFDGTLRQGLSAQLEQSPFLNLLSDQRAPRTPWANSLDASKPQTENRGLRYLAVRSNSRYPHSRRSITATFRTATGSLSPQHPAPTGNVPPDCPKCNHQPGRTSIPKRSISSREPKKERGSILRSSFGAVSKISTRLGSLPECPDCTRALLAQSSPPTLGGCRISGLNQESSTRLTGAF
ncbi:MAG TPA: serine/threonine-protein kinase [Terriglobales bacterium]